MIMAGADRHTSVTSPPDAPRLPSGHSRNSRQSTTTGNVAEAGGGGKGAGRGGSPPNTNSKMKRKNNQQQQEEEEEEDEDEEMNQSDPDVATNISKKKCVSQLKLHQLPNSKLLVSVMFSCQRSHKNELKHETKPRK